MHYSLFIGIDISKKTLDFAVRDQKGLLFHLKVDNSLAGLKQFQKECLNRNIALSQCLICWGSPAASTRGCTVRISWH